MYLVNILIGIFCFYGSIFALHTNALGLSVADMTLALLNLGFGIHDFRKSIIKHIKD